ncbi:NUDIX domain-containing protein [Corynebacterium sp. zg254]|uniref:NUDIX hydrolase n=1 Tax=Corynebacterium sp. zg254 TaxID=2656645 RepID=UPI002150D1E2|nr:CoA pyrophosphatase [Corynebacterium sp. zg254]MCR5914321.1 NUDIX domain-containing protein [Corynebacterium sp. zg254]
MDYPFEQWYAAIDHQPDLPGGLDAMPTWIQDVARVCRETDIHQHFSDNSRKVPETGPNGHPPRYSAVLILLGERESDGAPEILLTHRTPTMRTHSGQMAFPGGGWESQDPDPIHTAVREAQEETDLDPESITPIAVLQPLYIDRTNFAVVPVLAYWHAPHPVHPATAENDWVETVAIADLVNPENRFRVEYLGWHGPAFYVHDMILWGFTGGVVDALLERAGWAQPWDTQRKVDLFSALAESSNGEALADMRKGFRGELDR